MKLRVKTSLIQDMLSKVVKGASNNKMIPLTGLLSINLESGTLSLTTSDAVNFFTVLESPVEGENFSVVVKVDLFSKLISKTTSDFVTLEVSGNALSVSGNGTYNIELPLNEEGNLIKFPSANFDNSSATKGVIKLSTIKSAIMTNKPSLATSAEEPHLTAYYCTSDCIISADNFNICVNKITTFPKNVLIAPIVFDLLAMSDAEDIQYEFTDSNIKFTTPKMCLYAKPMKGVEDYPEEAIRQLAEGEFTSSCTLPKTLLVNVLDRLSLFIGDYDVNGVNLTFTTEGVRVSSSRNNASELIPYQGSDNFTPYTCLLGVDSFKKQVLARSGELVNLHYGNSFAIKLVDNNITQIVALFGDEVDE